MQHSHTIIDGAYSRSNERHFWFPKWINFLYSFLKSCSYIWSSEGSCRIGFHAFFHRIILQQLLKILQYSLCQNLLCSDLDSGSLATSNALWMRAMPLSREGVEAWWLVILPIVMETLGGFHKVAGWYDGTNKRRNKVFIHFPTFSSPLFLRISSGTAQDL